MQALVKFITDDEGTTSVEYAVVLACILVAIISAVSSVGGETAGMWSNIDTKLAPILSGSP